MLMQYLAPVLAVWFLGVVDQLWSWFKAALDQKGFHDWIHHIDRLGNVLCGGNWHATISARVGFFAGKRFFGGWQIAYWLLLEQIIDWAFYPYQGAGHCKEALAWEKRKDYERGPVVYLALLALLACLGSVLIRLFIVLFRLKHPKYAAN